MNGEKMTSSSSAVDALIVVLNRGDEVDRCHAAQALGRLRDPRALEPLYRHLQDEDLDVCVDAATALGHFNHEDAVQGLIDALHYHSEPDVKQAAVDGLSHSGTPRAIDTLQHLLTRPDDIQWSETDAWDDWWDLQRQAVIALGEHAVAAAAPALAALLDSDDGQDIESEILKSLAQIGAAGIAQLRPRLERAEPRRVRRIATALAFASSDEGWELLTELLDHVDADVRQAATATLVEAAVPDRIALLVARLEDRAPEVQATALKGLERLHPRDTDIVGDEQLLELLRASDDRVRCAALQMLSARLVPGEMPAPRLLERIGEGLDSDHEEELRLSCALAARAGLSDTSGRLRELAGNEETPVQVRRQAMQSIGQLGLRSRAILEMLWANSESRHPELRHVALQTLLELTDAPVEDPDTPTPLALLLNAITDTPVAWTAEPAATPEIRVVPPTTPDAASSPDLQQILQSVSADYPPPLEEAPQGEAIGSTLESISRSNIEAAVGAEPELSGDSERILGLVDALPEEYADFAEVVHANARTGERMIRREHKQPEAIHQDRRMLAARVLGECADAAAVQPLLACLMDPDPELRREAASSLGRLAEHHPELPGLANMLGPVATQLRAGNEEIRRACAGTLGALKRRSSIPALLAALDDPDTLVRIEAIRSLTAIATGNSKRLDARDHVTPSEVSADRITQAIADCREDPEIGVRKAIIDALVELRHPDLELLLSLGLEEGGALTPAAGVALRTLAPDPATERLIQALDEIPDSSIRRLAIRMLQEIHAA